MFIRGCAYDSCLQLGTCFQKIQNMTIPATYDDVQSNCFDFALETCVQDKCGLMITWNPTPAPTEIPTQNPTPRPTLEPTPTPTLTPS